MQEIERYLLISKILQIMIQVSQRYETNEFPWSVRLLGSLIRMSKHI